MMTNKNNGNNEGLKKLFIDELKDIYWAEKAMTKAIPKMSKKASDDNLINALETHLSETENQVTRLEKIFQILTVKPQAKKCPAMAGLIEEADNIMAETEEGSIRDVGIISAAQKVEHYEIATYGTLRAFAEKLKFSKVVDLLEETLAEEKNADKILTHVAESCFSGNEMSAVGIDDENEMYSKGKPGHL